jgi:ABC-2 type transport system ATP-binding protein
METTTDATTLSAPSSQPPTAVQFDKVTRRFGDVTAIDGIDLDIRPGETVALLGPNGAGKSTAISMMLGLLRPTSGAITILGLEPTEAVASGRVGSMLQTSGLPINVRVGELVDFARRLYPSPLPKTAIVERAGLLGLLDRTTDTLSGGEAQRLRFAFAIAGDPDLVFLDEPTVAMDVEMRRAFWTDMRRSADEGRTILFATHYLEEADQVADRVVVLDHGRVAADGTSREIRARVREKTVQFDLAAPDPAVLRALPGVTGVVVHDQTVRLTTADADATVRALYGAGLAISNLEVAGADLEDAFIALTTATDTPATTRKETDR